MRRIALGVAAVFIAVGAPLALATTASADPAISVGQCLFGGGQPNFAENPPVCEGGEYDGDPISAI